ncbi:MAG: NAD+ synthase, partial [Pseudomonadales bacterium]
LAGAELIVNINASPYHYKKHHQRIQIASERARENSIPIIYAHMVGGQDELVFDGGSFAVDSTGNRVYQAAWFEPSTDLVEISRNSRSDVLLQATQYEVEPEPLHTMYSALVLGVRDYIDKNGFNGVVIGLSGGIDSALTLAVAVDALGPERVEAVMMPFRYTSQMSQNDASEQARRMGVSYKSIGIEPMYDAFMKALADEFAGLSVDKTEENIQARCRGLLLMAISNKKGYLVLTTGNKSEMSVGYATLYGDMAGGFSVLKDISKMRVFALARYRNSISEVIPQNVIDRPPSAELAPDQKDEDSLPPYEVLDQILEMYIEDDMSAQAIIEAGFNDDVVYKVVKMVDINEYKRRQSAIGPRVTPRGFGKDRRYPITNLWEIGD